MPWSKFSQIQLAGGRRRIALSRLQASTPTPLLVPYLGSGWMVLFVHPSTVKLGHWQATTFDLLGPVGDCSAPSWSECLEQAHGYGVDWTRATPARFGSTASSSGPRTTSSTAAGSAAEPKVG